MISRNTRNTGRSALGEPAGSPGPDVWPFEMPVEQRERITPDPARDERGREGDVERAPD
jgi:hypothetical protein